mmetsp:Transcript_21814/g.69676  ORF Transcript_21814/g.69676 Transcript_21814/m.69676 type:complete len:206 (-) Transcript_21814:145-762(-)
MGETLMAIRSFERMSWPTYTVPPAPSPSFFSLRITLLGSNSPISITLSMSRCRVWRVGSFGGGPSRWNCRTSSTSCGCAATSSREIPDTLRTCRHLGGRPVKPVELRLSTPTCSTCCRLYGVPMQRSSSFSSAAAALFFFRLPRMRPRKGLGGATWAPITLIARALVSFSEAPLGTRLAHTSGRPRNVPVASSHSTCTQRSTLEG